MARHARRRSSAAAGAAAVLLVVGVAIPSAAQARGFVGFGFTFPLVVGAPPAYYPPPAYAYPVYPAYPPPVAVAAPRASGAPYCREYQATSTIDGRPQPVYGTACRQADGTWRIVSQKEE